MWPASAMNLISKRWQQWLRNQASLCGCQYWAGGVKSGWYRIPHARWISVCASAQGHWNYSHSNGHHAWDQRQYR